MAMNEELSFIKGLTNKYMQFKMMQIQQQNIAFNRELAQRREERYERQLQDQQSYNQRRLSQFDEALKISREKSNAPSASITFTPWSPSQIEGTETVTGVRDIIMESIGEVPKSFQFHLRRVVKPTK